MVIQTTRSTTATTQTPTKTTPSKTVRPRKPIRTAPALDLSTLKVEYDPSMEVPKASRPMGLHDAPTYWPTEKEWADPLSYIQSIAEEGKKYGICKVIPPKGWRPQFSVDTERFFFRTRKQELNSMEGATRSNMSYLDKLAKFHRQQGTTLSRPPLLDKQPIDLYALKRAVDSRGGFKDVCAGKKWAEIGREMGYGQIKNVTSVSTALKNAFTKYLLPYETYLEKAKPDFLRDMGLTPSPQQERTKRESPATSPLAIRRNLMDQLQKSDQDVKMDDIKEEDDISNINDDMKDMTPTPSQNGLKRSFEESTVRSTSISTENEKESEPTRRESKRLKKDATAPMVVGSNMAQHAHSIKPSRMGRMGSVVGITPPKKPGENCEVCGRGDNALSMLLCDGCDTGYHTFCLDPPLKSIPKYDWYCTECLVGTNEFGFEDGEEYSLSEFQKKANSFREDYIRRKLRTEINNLEVTEEQVEAEFWRMVSNVQETVEVDYGADIHSTTHGSGFPTVETNPTDPYATDPWNLNVMPLDNQSLFRHIKSDVSGMTVPWLYVGMMFSTFCWHNEDHYCYSINYQHFGATKTWYGIPGSDSEKFEAAMRNAVPDLFETQPDLLFQLVTMLSPGRLVEEGVKVYAVDQRPNQFVITFPQAYHAGFNHGFNMNEAVNFAPSDWEEYGRACVERYSEYKKMPVFSHDELLVTAALHDSSIKTARWLTSAMDIMVDRELRSREETRQLFPDIEETIIEEDFPSDEYYQCSVCKTYIYLSQITCPCTTNAVCPSHASELCDCEVDTRVLRLRYTDQDLIDLATKISDRAKIPEVWSQKFNAVMSEYERPPLRLLRSLLSEADRIPYPLPELSTLKAFVERANEWVEEATSFVSRKHQNRRKNERVWRSGSRVQELEERDRAQRSSEYVYKLLDQAEELGFDAAEIELLRAKAEAIEEFQERAKMALDEGSANTLEEYTELIDVGKSLNVDLPALDTLERIVDQLKWIEKATDTTDLYLSLEEVLMVMEDGERCGISLDHELMKQLAARRNKGQVWENCASTLLASENLSLRDLEVLLDDATDLSIHKETYDKVESIVIRTKEATQHVKTLRNRITPSVAQNPTFAEARRALKVLEELPAKGTDFTTFKRIVAVTEEWVKRGKRLFGKTNASVNQLEDHLAFVLQRNDHVFDPLDVPNREDESPGAMENKDSEDGPYCICRSGPTGEMVECDKCKEWYHMKCLRINKKKFDQNEGWDCPICDWHKEIPRSASRPSLKELKEWVKSADDLPFLPDELAVVKKIIEGAEAWISSIQPFIRGEPPATHSLSKCRFYLRKLEGAEIFLPREYNLFRRAAHTLSGLTTSPPPLMPESRLIKKRTKKPKPETFPRPLQLPQFSMRQPYEPQSQEQRILPAHRATLEQTASKPYQQDHRYPSYPSHSVPTLQLPPQPPKGVFAPPHVQTNYIREEHHKPPERAVRKCGSCKRPFVSELPVPLDCTQCHRPHHALCIAKYGGRLYPAFVCAHCVKQRPNSFQTLPPVPPKRPQHHSWAAQPPLGTSLNHTKPVSSIPPANRAVIDLTESRSPSPDVRQPPAVAGSSGRDPRMSIASLGQSTQWDVGQKEARKRLEAEILEKRNVSTPPSTNGRPSVLSSQGQPQITNRVEQPQSQPAKRSSPKEDIPSERRREVSQFAN